MAMVEEQGSTATACGKVNFGAPRGKVAIALQRGRVYISIRRGGGVNTAVLFGSPYRHALWAGRNFCCTGGEGGAAEMESVNIAAPFGEVNLAYGFASIWRRVLSGRPIFRSALLNLPQTGSPYLPAS